MRRLEMYAVVCYFVVFDDDEAGDQEVGGKEIEACMGERAGAFLDRCMGRLEDEDRLGEQQEGRRTKQGMCGKEA